jgi:DNA topoisomerase-2
VIEYESPLDILENYYSIRYDFYKKRKEFLITELEKNIRILASKYIFIKSVIENEIEIRNKSTDVISKQLDTIKNIIKCDGSYDYLLNMPMSSITKEKYVKLKEQLIEMKNEYKRLFNSTIEDLWKSDLTELLKEYKDIC